MARVPEYPQTKRIVHTDWTRTSSPPSAVCSTGASAPGEQAIETAQRHGVSQGCRPTRFISSWKRGSLRRPFRLDADFDDVALRQRPGGQACIERHARDQFHDEKIDLVLGVEIVDDGDAGMTEPGKSEGLLAKPPARIRLCQDVGRQHLDGDVPVETRILGTVDNSHASGTNLLEQLEMAEDIPQQLASGGWIIATAGIAVLAPPQRPASSWTNAYNRRVKSLDAYDDAYARSLRDPEAFWAEAAQALPWQEKWTTVLDRSRPPFFRWFAGGVLNTCYCAVDRHANGPRADQLALIYDSPVTGVIRRFTYRELRDAVARVAGALRNLGVSKGDRVLIFMPNTPEAVMAMLASARLGAVHSVVFGGFASRELATRIDDARPKVIVWASCGIEPGRVVAYKPLLDGALELASHRPEACLVLQRPMEEAAREPGRDYDWTDAVEVAEPVRECVPVLATDPLYILYTSGTTGRPKGVVHDNGGYAVALAWSLPHIYGAEPGDVYWAASDLGWAVGHSYIVYGPLLHGCTTVLYEGKPVGTPDAGAFWRVVSQHGVKILFTAPTAFRAIKRADPTGEFIGRYDLSPFRTLFLAGERADPDTIQWAERRLGVPVIDHWWQTETGWPICANPMGLARQPVKYGSAARPMPGYSVRVVDAGGREVKTREIGNIVIELPLPPGCLPTLWNNDDGFVESYLTEFPGYYKTADAGFEDEDGYFWIMTRTDDVINVAGHRLSTGEMEEVLAAHPDVAECAVVGVRDAVKGQIPFGLLVLKNGVTRDPADVISDVVAMVRDRIGPVAAFKDATVVDRLPKTRSGKVLRGTIRSIADDQPYSIPATIDDPAILDEITDALHRRGYGRRE